MNIEGAVVLVTGGASGLGFGTAKRLHSAGAKVVLTDLPGSDGASAANALGNDAVFVPGDVTSAEDFTEALDTAQDLGPLRAVVHCAGRGGRVPLVEADGSAGDLEKFQEIVNVNLVGTFNVLRLAAARMSAHEPIDGERGVFVLTSSVAAFEGQIGHSAYASSKAGVVGITLPAARDLARDLIRVCTIAPGLFDTPLFGGLPGDTGEGLKNMLINPGRLGTPDEFAHLAAAIIENPMLNGETIRIDGAIRLQPQ